MKTLLIPCALLLAGLLPAVAFAQEYVECGSENGRTNRCRADTRGNVSLTTQYSRSGCYYNDTWGYDRDAIWVSNGCRAEFRIDPAYSGGSRNNHDNKAATAAAVALLGVAVLAASSKHKDGHDDDGDDYDDGCKAARRDRGYNDHASRSWRNGYHACR